MSSLFLVLVLCLWRTIFAVVDHEFVAWYACHGTQTRMGLGLGAFGPTSMFSLCVLRSGGLSRCNNAQKTFGTFVVIAFFVCIRRPGAPAYP